MAEHDRITKHMTVYGSDGAEIGRVDDVDAQGIKLTRKDSADGRHHHVPLSAVERVDTHVHLNRTAAALGLIGAATGAKAGETDNRTGLPPLHNPAVPDAPKRTNYFLPWILAGIALLVLLILLTRACARDPEVASAPPQPAPSTPVATPAPVESVTLPGGGRIDLEPNTLNYSLQRFLASAEPAPRTFTFDRLNFDTASAAIRAEDQATLDALARILAAYPNARATVTGYTDARGAAASNAALGGDRARAVVDSLVNQGIARDRLNPATGGENNPKESNASAEGQFENRRTELTITAK